MRNLLALPLLGLAVILQSSVISQMQLLSGHLDLILLFLAAWTLQERVESAWHWTAIACLFTAFVSGMPWPVIVVGYSGVVYLAQLLQKRVWQVPLLAMFSVVFIGTLATHFISFGVLRVTGTPLSFEPVLYAITLPSLLLNMLFSIPIYAMVRDLAEWVYPVEDSE